MERSEQLVDPATLRIRLVGDLGDQKAIGLKVTRTNDEDAAFYACTSCQRSHLDKADAEKCCTPYTCRVCGVETARFYLSCERHNRGSRLLKAKIVDESPCGWVFDETGGGHQDGYFDSVESLLEWYTDQDGEEAPRPPYVYACKERRWSGISVNDILQSELEEHHEDAEDFLVDVKALHAFLDTWNAKQNIVSFDADYSRVIPLDRDRFSTLIAELTQEFSGATA